MAAQEHALDVPPVEVVFSEFVASLAGLAHAYIERVDFDAAEITIDLAGKAYDRIEPRLASEERSAMARILTDLRLSYVRKRDL